VLILGGVHGNEFGGPVAAAFLSYVRAHPSVVPSGTELDIVAFANPDGQSSNGRANARNVDINRNFPASNWSTIPNLHGTLPGIAPGSEPETQALLRLFDAQHYARIISLHSDGGIIDWDGPGGWTLARRMGKAAHVRLLRLKGYDGSMGSLVPERYHTPVVTWELADGTFDWHVREGLLAALR
jgi:protein MpaA